MSNNNRFNISSFVEDFDISSFADATTVEPLGRGMQPTIGQGEAPIDPNTFWDIQPERGFGIMPDQIENPAFFEQTEEQQKESDLLSKTLGLGEITKRGLKPRYLPHGKLGGLYSSLAQGLDPLPKEENYPQVGGSSQAVNLIGGLTGEGLKYYGLSKTLGAFHPAKEALVGGMIGAGREVNKENPSLENVLIEGVAAGSITGLFGAITGAVKGEQFAKFVDDVTKAKSKMQLRTEEVSKIKTMSPFLDNTPEQATVLSTMGYNPEIAKLLQQNWSNIVDKGVEQALTVIPKNVQKFISDKFISPAPSAARKVLKEADMYAIQGKKMAEDIAASIRENVPKEFHNDLIRTIDNTLFGDMGNLPKEYRPIAEMARKKIDELGAEYTNLGLLDEATFNKNMGSYLARYYLKDEKPVGAIKRIFKRNFIKGNRSQKRKLKTIAQREKARLIADPAYAVSRTIGDLTFDIGNAKAFRKIAQNKEWAKPYEEFTTASEAASAGFVHLPKNKAYGDLSDMWVEKGIYDELNMMIPNSTKNLSNDPVWREAVDFYDIMLTSWKYNKTALNPATHGRNIFSNIILADFGGLSPLNMKVYSKTFSEYSRKGVFYKEAVDNNLLGTDWYGSEIKNMGKVVNRSNKKTMIGFTADLISDSKFGRAMAKPGDLYQAEEHFFKLALFIQRRQMGDSPAVASAHAQKYLFNYSELSPFLKKLRRSPVGGPFLAFTAKSLPVIVETAVKRPVKFFKYPAMFWAFNEMSKSAIGMSDEEYDQMQETLPEWQKNTWLTPKVLLPVRGQKGKPRVLDLTYNLPWGQIGEQGKLFKNVPFLRDNPLGSLVDPFIGSNPFANLTAEGLFNKKLFTDREIYNKSVDDNMRATGKLVEHGYRQLAPGIALNLWDVIKAFKGDVNRFGDKYDPLSTVLSKLAGIKIIDVNIDKNTEMKVVGLNGKVDEIIKEAYRLDYDQSISEEDKLKEVEYFKSQLEKLYKEYEKLGITVEKSKKSKKRKKKNSKTDKYDLSSF